MSGPADKDAVVSEVKLRVRGRGHSGRRVTRGWWDRLGETLDNAIGVVSPRRALRRQTARNRRYALQAVRKILGDAASDAASISRLNSSWSTVSGSADADTLSELSALRGRSRRLMDNDGHANGIISTIVNNVVGTGIQVQSLADGAKLGISDKAAEALRNAQEDAWESWGRTCDASGRLCFESLERQVAFQILMNGEAFLLRADLPGRPYRFAWMHIEADRVDSPPEYEYRRDLDVRKGIELGKFGEPVAYWISKVHPGDDRAVRNKADYEKVPAYDRDGRPNVLHIYDQRRPGQRRGVPFLRPVMQYFQHLSQYLEAELVAARVAACFALVINEEGDPGTMTGHGELTTVDGQTVEALEPGMILRGSGISPTQIKPERPGESFDPFVQRVLRLISAGCELPYELVAKDFSESNYSNMRAALLEARRFFRVYQQLLGQKLIRPSWGLVQEEAFLRGYVSMPDFYANREAYLRVAIVPPGWEWVDPEKEVRASLRAVAGNLSTLAIENAARGHDYAEVLEQRALEERRMKELGLENKEDPVDERVSTRTEE